jgi:hypothetical protein
MVKAVEVSKPNLDPEHITLLVDKWRERLGIGLQWTIGVKVIDERKDGTKGYRDCFAFTEVEEAYFTADITFNGWRFPGKDDAYVDLVACHEVLHILLHKLEHLTDQALGDEHIGNILTENVVELISRALVALQDGKR